jgi:hypothetical protein
MAVTRTVYDFVLPGPGAASSLAAAEWLLRPFGGLAEPGVTGRPAASSLLPVGERQCHGALPAHSPSTYRSTAR